MPVLREKHVQEAAHRCRFPIEGNGLVRDRFPQQRQRAVDLDFDVDFRVFIDIDRIEGIVVFGNEVFLDRQQHIDRPGGLNKKGVATLPHNYETCANILSPAC